MTTATCTVTFTKEHIAPVIEDIIGKPIEADEKAAFAATEKYMALQIEVYRDLGMDYTVNQASLEAGTFLDGYQQAQKDREV